MFFGVGFFMGLSVKTLVVPIFTAAASTKRDVGSTMEKMAGRKWPEDNNDPDFKYRVVSSL